MQRTIAAMAVLMLAWSSSAAAEDEANPTGTWRWKLSNQSAHNTLKLKLDGDKLTGVVLRRIQGEVPIHDATYQNGKVSFKANLISERGDDRKILAKFVGKVSGDTIKGTVEFKHPDRIIIREWNANRVEK